MFWNRNKNGYGTPLSSRTRWWGLLLLLAYLACPVSGQYYAYVSNAGEFMDGVNDDLSIIDLASNKVVATVTVGDYPQGVAINPAGTRAYVANTMSNEFTIIDTITQTANTLPAGPAPCGVTVHPDGERIYLANADFPSGEMSSVWVIDRADNTVTDQISCGKGSITVAVHPNGKVAYVPNTGDGTVAVFSTETHEVLDTIVLSTSGEGEPCVPVPIVVHPEGTYVYVANRVGPTLWAINTSTHESIALAFGHRHVGIAINPAGTVLYLPDFDDEDPNLPPQGTTMDVIDTKTLELIKTIDGLNAPLDVSVHPDGTRLYVTNTGSDTVSVIDAITYDLITTIAVGKRPHGYGSFIGPGVPRSLKENAVDRLDAVRKAIQAGAEGIGRRDQALEHIEEALDSGNMAINWCLWSGTGPDDVDPHHLEGGLGDISFWCDEKMAVSIVEAIEHGWILNEQISSEMLAIVEEIIRANHVLVEVCIDDAIVGKANADDRKEARQILQMADALAKEATESGLENKSFLLSDAINEYSKAWECAFDCIDR